MRYSYKFIFPGLLFVTMGLTSCGEDDTLADLIPINSTNAEGLIALVFVNKNLLSGFNAEGRSPSIREIVALTKQARTDSQEYKQIMATTSEPTRNCTRGSYTIILTETGNTESGSLTFNDCVVGGVTLRGGWNFSDTHDSITSDYEESSSGSITATNSITGNVVSVNLDGLNFAVSGNRDAGTYVISEFSLALSVTAAGLTATAFKVELIDPIVESGGDACPESGSIKISGGLGTFAVLTYDGSGSSLSVNGVPVSTSGICYI